MRRLIVTADDFGLAVPVNEAVEQAHREGVLTCASLMVGGAAAEDAVERARRMPTLKVGLHVVVVEGRMLTSRGREFPRNLVLAGFRYFFLPSARRLLRREIRAQFEVFRATGLPLDHVNAHNHMHLHPTILRVILEVGREYGMKAMRVPSEPGGSRLLGFWISRLRAILREHSIASNDIVLGLSDSGAMTAERAAGLLAGLPDGVTEMYFHPATRRCPEIDRDMWDYRHEDELATLVSPRFRTAIEAADVEMISYSDLTQ